MKIRDIMTTDVWSVTPETTYSEVAKLLHKKGIGSVPVCDKHGTLVGIISEKDLFRAMFPNYGDYYETPISSIDSEEAERTIDELRSRPISKYMIKKVTSMRPEEPIMKAGGLMLARHIHQLPIVEKNKLVGIISREDVFSAILGSRLGF